MGKIITETLKCVRCGLPESHHIMKGNPYGKSCPTKKDYEDFKEASEFLDKIFYKNEEDDKNG